MTKAIKNIILSVVFITTISIYSQCPASLTPLSTSTYHITHCEITIKGLDDNYVNVFAKRLDREVYINYDAKTFNYIKGEEGDKGLPELEVPVYKKRSAESSVIIKSGLNPEFDTFYYTCNSLFDENKKLIIEYGYSPNYTTVVYNTVSPVFNDYGSTISLFCGISASLYDSSGVQQWSYVFPRMTNNTFDDPSIGRPLLTIIGHSIYLFYTDSKDNFSTKEIKDIPTDRNRLNYEIICIKINAQSGEMQKTVVRSFTWAKEKYFLSQCIQLDTKSYAILGHNKLNWGFYKLSINE